VPGIEIDSRLTGEYAADGLGELTAAAAVLGYETGAALVGDAERSGIAPAEAVRRRETDPMSAAGPPPIPDDLAPESRAIFTAMAELGLVGGGEPASAPEMREESLLERPVMGPKPAVQQVEEVRIEGPAGAVDLRIYYPARRHARAHDPLDARRRLGPRRPRSHRRRRRPRPLS